jgi:YHS domain-containing protein
LETQCCSEGSNHKDQLAKEVKTGMAKDPVCGMMVEEKTAKFKSQYKGKTYYFCAQGCKVTFDKNPNRYIGEQ